MYRDFPDNEIDSGWRFMSGKESQKYMDDPSNLEIYDVNTIANYDPEIIPLLAAPCTRAAARPFSARCAPSSPRPPLRSQVARKSGLS
jgi:hypothetical protein